ncbi:unnamed protein product [Hymenolepis diminuta]|uniref:Pur_ac_phosph_N domain-containing protein n=1 Tax=Hymenolepis diminuta TaxID=6216 RepID=A0A0R3SYY7_HYMDI|nr:unnamed protein product [Hymenolepis diminuta]
MWLVLILWIATTLADNAPEQIHLSLSGEEGSMTITWTTLQEAAHSGVLYGTEKPENYVPASQKAFVDGGEEQRVTYMHTVTLKTLQPNTSYGTKLFYALMNDFSAW